MLSVRGLTKVYGGSTVVDDVSFELQPGTLTAFLGPNGAGTSTTLRTGLTPVTAGASRVAGRPYREWPIPATSPACCSMPPAVHPGRTGGAHLRNAALLMGVPTQRVDSLLQQVGLADAARKKAGKYSGA